MKKILLLATGGTIASRETPHGLRPALAAADMRAAIGAEDAAVEVIDLLALDSTNIAPSHWQMIARKIAECRTSYDGFIVTHGTDTMAYTSAALYYMLEHIDRPVVITGAQRPLGMPDSDAKKNLRLACRTACSSFAGVCIAFGGRLIHGNAAKKMYSLADDAFRSIGRPDIDLEAPSAPAGPFRLRDALDTRAAVIRLYPGMKPVTISRGTDSAASPVTMLRRASSQRSTVQRRVPAPSFSQRSASMTEQTSRTTRSASAQRSSAPSPAASSPSRPSTPAS